MTFENSNDDENGEEKRLKPCLKSGDVMWFCRDVNRKYHAVDVVFVCVLCVSRESCVCAVCDSDEWTGNQSSFSSLFSLRAYRCLVVNSIITSVACDHEKNMREGL